MGGQAVEQKEAKAKAAKKGAGEVERKPLSEVLPLRAGGQAGMAMSKQEWRG